MKQKCKWKWEGEYWESECGLAWTLEDGTPKENSMVYCPLCGKPLIEVVDEFYDADEA